MITYLSLLPWSGSFLPRSLDSTATRHSFDDKTVTLFNSVKRHKWPIDTPMVMIDKKDFWFSLHCLIRLNEVQYYSTGQLLCSLFVCSVYTLHYLYNITLYNTATVPQYMTTLSLNPVTQFFHIQFIAMVWFNSPFPFCIVGLKCVVCCCMWCHTRLHYSSHIEHVYWRQLALPHILPRFSADFHHTSSSCLKIQPVNASGCNYESKISSIFVWEVYRCTHNRRVQKAGVQVYRSVIPLRLLPAGQARPGQAGIVVSASKASQVWSG